MKKPLCCLLAMLSCSAALAGNDLDWNRHPGYFAELNAGTNLYYVAFVTTSGHGSIGGVTGYSWSGDIGYNFNDYFGLETGFIQSDVDFDHGHVIDAPYLSTRITIPMGQRFSFIGKIGAMAPFSPGDGGIVLPFTGIGLGYAITPKLEVTAQYQGAVYGIAGVGLAGLGLTYHFG